MLRAITLFLITSSLSVVAAASECWTVTDLKGQSVRAGNDYSFKEDSISSDLKLIINDKRSRAPGWKTTCTERSIDVVVCADMGKPNRAFRMEVWTLDRKNEKVTLLSTQTRLHILSGASLFVGSAKKGCE